MQSGERWKAELTTVTQEAAMSASEYMKMCIWGSNCERISVKGLFLIIKDRGLDFDKIWPIGRRGAMYG